VPSRDEIAVRVFREKDIPVQIALGNYDLGVCSLAWVKEIQARFSHQTIVPLCDLGVQPRGIYAAGASSICRRPDDLGSLASVRIASDYPNMAETFARAARLPVYRVQPVWGAAEAYPPEDADCVVVSATDEDELRGHGLEPLHRLLNNSAWLIGNAAALADKDMSALLGPIMSVAAAPGRSSELTLPGPITNGGVKVEVPPRRDVLRMAVPDGHQQRHVVDALRAAGLNFEGYGSGHTVRRPAAPVEGLEVKVIRPHDMPSLVATGEIDIAITGRDCLMEHRYSFPTSPATEILDLRRGQYNLSAVTSEDLPASTIDEALDFWRKQGKKVLRVAAEFPATADHYARSRHFWRYQVMPIAGASEGFVPEDADLLIEGTETGKTLAENHLKVIDLLYRSTTCVIARADADLTGRRRVVFGELMSSLRRSSEASSPV
jgi:ATP phosphoribosyltransferase